MEKVIQKTLMTLGGFNKIVYDLLAINPTSKYVKEKTGKDKRIVATYLRRLEEKGYIKRLDWGVYKVIKKVINDNRAVALSHTDEYFRLHKLEVEIQLNQDQHKLIKNIVLKNNQYYNVRDFNNAGHYFTLDVTGLITKDKLFMIMPEGWERSYKSTAELYSGLYEVVSQTCEKWQQKFKISLIKEGRSNIRIVNCHVAYIKGDLCKEFTNKADFSFVMVRDEEDNKQRFVMDLSKGFIEFEFLHPQKQLIDIKEAEFFGKTLINGSYQKLLSDIQNKPYIPLSEISVYMANTSLQINEVSHGLKAIVDYLKIGIPEEREEIKEKPEYIG